MKKAIYLIAFIISISLFTACNNDDKFSTDSSLRLTFSSDTVRFDTVFTTLGTATKRLMVYNRNSDALTINNISLMNAEKTGFRMNVDGESGNTINNVDILGKDSIFIFLEVTLNPLDQNNPMLISDSIRFQFNGVTQYVRLEAIGQDVILWKGKTIDKDTTLTAEKPFLIYDSLSVKKGITLNIEKNTYLYFHDNAKFSISGNINAKGTIEEPIVMRADRTDNLSATIPYSRVPGQWYGITVSSESYNNNFENVKIYNGIYGIQFAPADTTQTKATLYNTVIQNTTKEVLSATNAKIIAKNSLFANAGTYTVQLTGGSYLFLQCTIVNYMNYIGIFKKGTLSVSEEASQPIGYMQFINTIISSSSNSSSEIQLNIPEDSKYKFINCLLRIKAKEDNIHFTNTVWNESPDFKYIYNVYTTDNTERYYYNFELKESSAARNKASLEYAKELPYDINGTSRLDSDGADIGCFQFKTDTETLR